MSYYSSAKAHYDEIRAGWMTLALLALETLDGGKNTPQTGPYPCPKILSVHAPWTDRIPHPVEMPTSSICCLRRTVKAHGIQTHRVG
ncbi:hypothetical protein BTI_1405 [Burkholderia thailandensis MSMB121]|nr:hypothetical protein BTI_1405 [Burkholderia thailandensis MSMB121]